MWGSVGLCRLFSCKWGYSVKQGAGGFFYCRAWALGPRIFSSCGSWAQSTGSIDEAHI